MIRHGMRHTKEYEIWKSMKGRCNNSRNKGWPRYGGRGIKVCDRWQQNFLNFFEDMGKKPKGRSIDRINNDGNYEPNNCRWATNKQQHANKKPPIVDEFTYQNISYVQKMHRRKKRDGKCLNCQEPPVLGLTRCDKHRILHNLTTNVGYQQRRNK